MFSKLKLQIVLGVLVVAIGIFVSRYLNNHSFVSDTFIKQKTDSIKTLKSIVVLKDSLLFDCHQTSDVSVQQLREQQIVLFDLQKQLKQAKNNCTQANEAIAYYEENGLMRFFKFDNNGLFKKGCYREVFEKPTNICK